MSLVVVTDEWRLSEATRRALLDLIERPVRFTRLPEFYEHYLRKIPLGTINDLWFLENIDLRSRGGTGSSSGDSTSSLRSCSWSWRPCRGC